MTRSLPNYIRMYRKRLHLSQRDVAALLGGTTASMVARHEKGERSPSLETALAYAAVFNTDVRELFAGLFEDQMDLVRAQAEELAEMLREVDGDDLATLKLTLLQGLLESPEPHLVPWETATE